MVRPQPGSVFRETLAGRFELRGEIKRGGFATIHYGVDRMTGNDVAIKIMSVEADSADKPYMDDLRSEIAALRRIAHPKVPSVVFVPPYVPDYFVMDLVRGRPLSDVMDDFNLRSRLQIAINVCDTLAAIHSAGIVHRDMKPHNIIISAEQPDPVPHIVDFGFAKVPLHRDLHLRSRYVLGTPEYMAPEQTHAPGTATDFRTDIYALGTLMYQMFSGIMPFMLIDNDFESLFEKIRSKNPIPLGITSPWVPPSLSEAVGRAMEKNPADRFQSAREFGNALWKCLGEL